MVTDIRETQIHEAGHAVAAYFFHPGSRPDVAVDGPRSGRTEFDTPEDPKVNAKICMAGIVAVHLILRDPLAITEMTMEDHGAGEDRHVVISYLMDQLDDDEFKLALDLALQSFAYGVAKALIPHIPKVIALADALEAATVGDQAYLDIDEVDAILKA
jgi:hypothetical protein